MSDLVDIVLPSGEQATVPKGDLAQAVAAGAHQPTPEETQAREMGTPGMAAATAATGLARTATFGLSDTALAEAGGLIGAEIGQNTLRSDTLKALRVGREVNPGANLAGEAAGLFLGPGGGVTAVGEGAEAAIASHLGEGLLGKAVGMGARGFVEGGMLGAQQQITEDTLGDRPINAQAVFSSAAKDALLGAGAGAVLGAGSHYLGEIGSGLLSKSRGPARDAVLDEIAGVPGAGRQLVDDAKDAQGFVENLRKTGATTEQATQMVDELNNLAKQRAAAGPVSGFLDDMVDRGASLHSSGSAADAGIDRGALIREQYVRGKAGAMANEAKLDQHALDLSRSGTKMLRNLEDTVNEVQFTHKPQQMAKLVDSSLIDAQRDSVASLLQDADSTLKFWEGTSAKGGAEGAIKSLRKSWTDALDSLAKVDASGSPTMSRDLFVKTDNFKRMLDSTLRWGGEHRFGLPEAITHSEFGLEPLTNRFRGALEDSSVWGEAGTAQKNWNGSFSDIKARRDHFMQTMGVSIDQAHGVRIPEVDFEKSRGLLGKLQGSESDGAIQGVRSTEDVISGFRARVEAIRKHADLTPQQSEKLTQGLKDLDAFTKTFGEARKEAAIVNRLKAANLEEAQSGIGGLFGLAMSPVTQPFTTAQRLAQIRQTTTKVESFVRDGLDNFLSKGKAGEAASKVRAKADIVKEIGDVRELAANPAMLEDRISKLVGDLAKHAPGIADEIRMTAKRAIAYLAQEAPPASVSLGILTMHDAKPRYSDQQVHDWEAKRKAAFDATTIVSDLKGGKINREAIKAVQFVSPQLFAQMQELARTQLAKMEERGELAKMPYTHQAAFATLLQVPASGTWQPDFMAMMQASKAQPPAPPPQSAGAPQSNAGVSKRRVEINTDIFATESQNIEGKAA